MKSDRHSNEIRTEASSCRIGESLTRNRYFPGRLLTVDDLQSEQQYFLEKQRRHNRLLHGFGVVIGLEVSTNKNVIRVEPGLALDCSGNEVVLGQSWEMSVAPSEDSRYLCFRYAEKEKDPVRVAAIQDDLENSKIEESFEIFLAPSNPAKNHRRRKSRWMACGHDHAIVLARLKQRSGHWSVDRRYRRPAIA